MIPPNKPSLSVSEIAALTGFPKESVRNAIRKGYVPAIRLGPRGDLRVPTIYLRPILRQLGHDQASESK